MTAFDRFDPFAGRVTSAMEEIAPASRPAYLDDVLAADRAHVAAAALDLHRKVAPHGHRDPAVAGLARRPGPPRSSSSSSCCLLAIAACGGVGRVARPGPTAVRPRGQRAHRLRAGRRHLPARRPGHRRAAAPRRPGRPALSASSRPTGPSSPTRSRPTATRSSWSPTPTGRTRASCCPSPSPNAAAVWGPDSRTIAVVTRSGASRPCSWSTRTARRRPSCSVRGRCRPDRRHLAAAGWRRAARPRPRGRRHRRSVPGGPRRHRHRRASTWPARCCSASSGRTRAPSSRRTARTSPTTVSSPTRSRVRALPRPRRRRGWVQRHRAAAAVGPDGPRGLAASTRPTARRSCVHDWTWSWEGNQGWLSVMPADGSAPARRIGPTIPGGEDDRPRQGLVARTAPGS